MKKLPPYINSAVASRDFKYYIFDWDDNILHMPTKIRMERLQTDGSWQGGGGRSLYGDIRPY